jgi:hypothetical protein
MSQTGFNRDNMARHYAKRHLKTDPGVITIYYLPTGAPEREIRLLEVNELIAERTENPIEPIDFGLDTGTPEAHKLMVADVTPGQWEKVGKHELALPSGWSLDNATPYAR